MSVPYDDYDDPKGDSADAQISRAGFDGGRFVDSEADALFDGMANYYDGCEGDCGDY